MLLQVVFLWLAACLQTLASNVATPWETLYFYNVYKAELADGVSEKTTGGGCVHEALNFPDEEIDYSNEVAAAGFAAGICIFDEFAKSIGDEQSWADYKYTKDGATINPDWAKINEKILNSAVRGTKAINFKKNLENLLTQVTFTTSAKPLNLPEIMKIVRDGIQTARAAFAALTDASEELIASFTKAVVDGRTYIKMAHQVRVGADAKYLNDAVVGYVKGTPFAATLISKQIFGPDGKTQLGTWNDGADYDAMLAAAPTATEDDKKSLKGKIDAFGTDADLTDADTGAVRRTKKAAIQHKNIYNAFKETTDVLGANIEDCLSSKKKRSLLASLDRFRSRVRRQNQRHLTKWDFGLILAS